MGVRMSCDIGTKDMSMGVPHRGNKVGAGYRHRCPIMETRYRQEDPGDTDGIVGEGLGAPCDANGKASAGSQGWGC